MYIYETSYFYSIFTHILLFLSRVGRNVEAKDAARGALKSPWWTLGCEYHVRHSLIQSISSSLCSTLMLGLFVYSLLNPMQEVANIAEWEDEQIEYIKEKVTEEGRQADLKKGKEPAQV